ncbi:Uncharacterised protein [Mycobacterium tuberculosis]|nr:Uncharacterised protein [Mycobacterium tuberculosis]
MTPVSSTVRISAVGCGSVIAVLRTSSSMNLSSVRSLALTSALPELCTEA